MKIQISTSCSNRSAEGFGKAKGFQSKTSGLYPR
jgi:hypothetical protein